jgi:thiol-disulfide isomerase/thioredoxin
MESSETQGWRVWIRRIAALVFIATACYVFFESQAYTGSRQISIADVEFRNLDGSIHEPSPVRGKPVILNFWAPWCAPCRREMPSLEKLHRHHQELAVLGVEADPEQYRNAGVMEGLSEISYPLLQFTPSLRKAIGPIHTLPTTLYISASGRVVHVVSGAVPEAIMEHYASSAAESR